MSTDNDKTDCTEYIPEEDNPYPLCDNRTCKDSNICCISVYYIGDQYVYENHK